MLVPIQLIVRTLFCVMPCAAVPWSQPQSETAVVMKESLPVGATIEVTSTVNLQGTSHKPKKDAKDPKPAAISASSSIRYREKILEVADTVEVKATARRYQAATLDKKIAEEQQRVALRPAVVRIVTRRANRQSMMFSPDGPLTTSEVDLLQGETFTPALGGLLPSRPVKPGDQWRASDEAATELTGIGPIQSGGLTCVFREQKTTSGRPIARINLSGSLSGPSDLGPTRDTVDGHFLFDLDQRLITYVVFTARREVLGDNEKPIGQLEGRYELHRRPTDADSRLTDAALAGVNLKPSPDTTALLFEGKDLGVRFLYPRNWELISATKGRIELTEPTGGNMRVSIDPSPPTTAEKLRSELLAWLKTQKATVKDAGLVKPFSGANRGEQFSVAAAVPKKATDQKAAAERLFQWEYVHLRKDNRAATVSASLLADRAAALGADVGFVARRLEFLPKAR